MKNKNIVLRREDFDFEIPRVIKEIKKRKAKTIFIQLPLGIKTGFMANLRKIEKATKTNVIVSGGNCWGGCDIPIDEARLVGADLIVHFGHAPFMKIDFPIIYVFLKDKSNLIPLVKKSLSKLKKYKKIGLISSIQHVHKLSQIKGFYEKNRKSVKIPRAIGHAHLSGHVVGCEYSGLKSIKSDLDAVVVLGNQFHALGAAMSLIGKPIILIDSYNNEVVDMSKKRDQLIKQRNIAIHKVKNAKKIGIVVGKKIGQKFGSFNSIKKELQKKGKEVMIITMDEMTPEKIMNFYDLEGFIELACPRIATDDYGKYEKPILTFREGMVVIDKLKWENLLKEGFI
jgi:2-(3-amino-3-carboxypropyl)histidine synthase